MLEPVTAGAEYQDVIALIAPAGFIRNEVVSLENLTAREFVRRVLAGLALSR
jgi:hypothetical protein